MPLVMPLAGHLLLVCWAIVCDIHVVGGFPEGRGTVIEKACEQPVCIEKPDSRVRIVDCKVVNK